MKQMHFRKTRENFPFVKIFVYQIEYCRMKKYNIFIEDGKWMYSIESAYSYR